MDTADTVLIIGAVGIGAYLLLRHKANEASAANASDNAPFGSQARKADNAQFANDILKPIDAIPYGSTVRKILSTTVGILTFPGRAAYTTDGKPGVIRRDGVRVGSAREVGPRSIFGGGGFR